MISFGLFPQASQPRMNFNISKLVYSAKRHATQLKTFKISNRQPVQDHGKSVYTT